MDESDASWDNINDDSYLCEISLGYERIQIFSTPQGLDTYKENITYGSRVLYITQSEVSSYEGINRFVIDAFLYLQEELGEYGISQICDSLRRFTSRVPPGTPNMALIEVVVLGIEDVSEDTYEFIYKECYLSRFRAQLMDSENNYSNMKLVDYKNGMGDGTCAICLVEFEEESDIVKTACCHYFHEECIGVWTMRKVSCPMCRDEIILYL